jgi:hypothetical protein
MRLSAPSTQRLGYTQSKVNHFARYGKREEQSDRTHFALDSKRAFSTKTNDLSIDWLLIWSPKPLRPMKLGSVSPFAGDVLGPNGRAGSPGIYMG